MPENLTKKIIQDHLVSGKISAGEEIALKIDQTLLPDSTGATASLEFEAIEIPSVKPEVAVVYSDHNTLQVGYKNADEQRFLKTFCQKYGIIYSPAGNGICHQLHLQRFAVPGKTLLGADSHTPTCGGSGMLSIGVGGLDLAVVMAGSPFFFTMPEVINVELEGSLQKGVSAKDVILEILRRLTVKGGTGKIFEYTGPGLESLTVPDRATITNMGAELGATTSIFPSDQITLQFMKTQMREEDWIEIGPDPEAAYDDKISVNLEEIEPLVAMPASPDNVKKVKDLEPIKVDQVVIGSCTNSFYSDLAIVASILDGKKIHPDVSLAITPGSRQVLQTVAKDGILEKLVSAGARILECACGPCVGVGLSPPTEGVSVRTTNRNFRGRSGTTDSFVYLASSETAAATALTGIITDPRTIQDLGIKKEPDAYIINDEIFVKPDPNPDDVQLRRGPNIKPFPLNDPVPDEINKNAILKVGDNISTDDIMPSGAELLSLRSNIPELSKHVYERLDPTLVQRVKKAKGGIIIAGENYGQGSSREHAASAPMSIGIKAVIAKSFARIHFSNLINFGVVPLSFKDKKDYDQIEQGDDLIIKNIHASAVSGEITVLNQTRQFEFKTVLDISKRSIDVLLAGGLINYVKTHQI